MVDRRTVEIPESQIEARIRFGAAVRNWFRINKWSQDVPHDYAKAMDLNGPWNSQISLTFNGKLDPKPQFWLSMESFNMEASGDRCGSNYRPPSKEPDEGDEFVARAKLFERIHSGIPFTTASGDVATAVDLFGMFIGRVQWDAKFDSEPLISDAEAEKLDRVLKKAVEKVMLDKMISRAELWKSLSAELTEDPEPLKRWLVGLDEYNPHLHQQYGQFLSDSLKARAE